MHVEDAGRRKERLPRVVVPPGGAPDEEGDAEDDGRDAERQEQREEQPREEVDWQRERALKGQEQVAHPDLDAEERRQVERLEERHEGVGPVHVGEAHEDVDHLWRGEGGEGVRTMGAAYSREV